MFFSVWWEALVHPEQAGREVLDATARRGFTRMLTALVMALYFVYGGTMGSFLGWFPAMVSALKLPFLFILTLAVCLPPLYVLNSLLGPKLGWRECLRLMVLAASANAAALASYAPFSIFFTMTSSREAYGMLTLMHVGVFGAAGLASLVVIGLVLRSTAAARGQRLRLAFVLGWGLLYALIGTQMSWVLRPWIGAANVEYHPFRPIGGTFLEAVAALLASAFS